MGAWSTHGGILAALEGGGSGAFYSSAAEALLGRANVPTHRQGVRPNDDVLNVVRVELG
jgi:hypothetical protein